MASFALQTPPRVARKAAWDNIVVCEEIRNKRETIELALSLLILHTNQFAPINKSNEEETNLIKGKVQFKIIFYTQKGQCYGICLLGFVFLFF